MFKSTLGRPSFEGRQQLSCPSIPTAWVERGANIIKGNRQVTLSTQKVISWLFWENCIELRARVKQLKKPYGTSVRRSWLRPRPTMRNDIAQQQREWCLFQESRGGCCNYGWGWWEFDEVIHESISLKAFYRLLVGPNHFALPKSNSLPSFPMNFF